MRPLAVDTPPVAHVVASDDLVDEAAVGPEIVEGARAAQQKRVGDGALEVTVRPFNGAVLVGDAGGVAGGRHPVVGAQGVVAVGEIAAGLVVEVAEGCGQAVGAMLGRSAAKRPQRVLQALRQSHEALAAEDHMGVLEAGIGQPKVIETVVERRSGHHDGEIAHVGEIGEPEPARRQGLTEDHLLLGTMLRPPGPDAPLQRPPHAGSESGMPAHEFLEHGDRPQARRGLEHRHDLAVEHLGQRIGTPTFARRPLLRGQARVASQSVARRDRESGLGGRRGHAVGLSEGHEEPHLMVGDMAARHGRDPPRQKDILARPAGRDHQPSCPKQAAERQRRWTTPVGPCGPPCVVHRRQTLTLIDAPISP